MYCALCNGVMTENIKFWKAVTDCSWEETILFNDEGEELPDKERKWFGCFYIYGYNTYLRPMLVTRGHNVLIRGGLSTSMPLIIGFELNPAMIGGVEISPA